MSKGWYFLGGVITGVLGLAGAAILSEKCSSSSCSVDSTDDEEEDKESSTLCSNSAEESTPMTQTQDLIGTVA